MSRNPQTRHSRERRALSNVGGHVHAAGDPAVAELLRVAARPPEDADPRALTHGFHAWPARMHPFTARTLIAAAAPGPIADPFMGGGTVPLEAMLAGRAALGGDVNPIALEVAWARTRYWKPGRLAALEPAAVAAVEAARRWRAEHQVPSGVRVREHEWFDAPALAEAWSLSEVLKPRIAAGDETARMLRVCLSAILIKASRQVSDSVPMRDVDHHWIPVKRVENWFVSKAHEHAEQLALLAAQIPAGASEPRLALADARRPPPDVSGLGAIITSPPYPGVYDYAAHHERRYSVLGIDATLAREAEVGARREVRHAGAETASERYVVAMATVLGAWRVMLAPTGRIFLVVGDGQSADGPIPVVPLLRAAALRAGCPFIAAVSQPRPSYGPGGDRPVGRKEEHVVAFGRGTA